MILRRCQGPAGLLCIVLATLLPAGCSSFGKWGSRPTLGPGTTTQSSAKKYKDPVNEFLATNPRVPFDGVRK
jgi:hypothetical protein